uniref:UBC core domain-containing protein n=1 Tax=Gossypium raimondii TaxID=29730 RepID=A0A0D2THH3_GOSRA|nr:hypothetical protein B456_007G206300 [Gossypium raimondii]
MIRLFKVKEKQRELAENANGGAPTKKQSPGELRLHKDISELNLPKSCAITFPNGKDNLMNFEVSIRPDEGYYFGGTFLFSFQVSPVYPHEAPKVKCKTKVYHPNIDLEGNVCLNILREDWKPVLNINTIIYGLYHLFTVMPSIFIAIILWICCHLISESLNFVCRNRIMRIPSIMKLLQC